MGRVGSKKYYAPDGNEYDSREEYLYLQTILDDPGISCIHRQVTITAINPVWMLKPKQLKTKVKYEIGISLETIGRALGHSVWEKTVTAIYVKYDNKAVDEANRKVIDYLNG